MNCIFVWGLARVRGGRVLLRIEDHDRLRSRPEFERAIVDDLEWLGFVADEGHSPIRRQSDHDAVYAGALARLQETHHVYACDCSRREIGGGRYPGRCRDRRVRSGELAPAGAGIRVAMDERPERFHDLALGEIVQTPAEQCGDLLLKDRDGNWTYQFAVVVDDINDGIDLVVRGLDLLSSTGRQIKLGRMLGRDRAPAFFHHPLIVKPGGEKLSKASRDTGVRELRAAGIPPPAVIGRAAAAAGLLDRFRAIDAVSVADLVAANDRPRGQR